MADASLAQQFAETIREAYAEAEQKILRAIASRLRRGITADGWAEQKLREIRLIRQEIAAELGQVQLFHAPTMVGEELQRPLIEDWLTDAFAQGETDAAKQLTRWAGITNPELIDAPKAGLRALSRQLVGDIQAGEARILRGSLDIYRSVIAQSNQQVLLGSQTRLGAAQSALNRFAARGVSSFTDKAGRNWDMASYAEMSVRTGTAKAANEGRFGKFVANGKDLVYVSDSPEECELCRRWEGKILSISGDTPGYQTRGEAEADGLFHPGCTHTVALYTPGLTRVPTDTENAGSYEERQRQREIERTIRHWKKQGAVAVTPDRAAKCTAKVREWQGAMREFIDETGRLRQRQRESIVTAR